MRDAAYRRDSIHSKPPNQRLSHLETGLSCKEFSRSGGSMIRWIVSMSLVLLGVWAGNSVFSLIAIGCFLALAIFFIEVMKAPAGRREIAPLQPPMQGGG